MSIYPQLLPKKTTLEHLKDYLYEHKKTLAIGIATSTLILGAYALSQPSQPTPVSQLPPPTPIVEEY